MAKFTRNNPNAAPSPVVEDNSWKATAFLNIYLPGKNGKNRKIGTINLKDARVADRSLIEYLNADEGNLDKLHESLILQFNMAEGNDESGYALPA